MERRNPSSDGWHSVHEWAKRVGCCVRTIRNYTRRGLRHSKIGAAVLIHESDWDAFLNAHARGGNLPTPNRRC
jgi:hypothetical protein